ncbi:AAA family ATPase [uncultured Phascolarctobacterium sp.]|uniref:AAA family ATPase n=1 Tax=uncultured Phascolarctobacterium sp. TaxID=512296 RepID=UPI0025DBACCB|nr:AAA family ATPase [uncultured Phascolarctobacterium sp.]
MKILRITVNGLPLFKQELDLLFYTQQRVGEDDKEKLYKIEPNYYLHTACAFIGINASGKTSVLKVINLALNILRNEPINHVESRNILGACERATFKICFLDKKNNVYCLKTVITSKKAKAGRYVYSIIEEKLWEKPISSVKSKKYLTDFTAISPIAVRNTEEAYLPDDVSFIIAHNKKANDKIDVFSLLSYTNIDILPFTEDIPLEVIAFLDPTIEKLYFEKVEDKASIHLKFKDEEEIILNNAVELEQYLSSGTIKGIITFSIVKEVLASGGYILVDELENHFNKEIVVTLIRFFMDSSLNKNGSTLIFTTHYPELLDEYDRNDAIYIVRNRNGITAENLSYILKRNDIKKSDAYQSGFLEGTTPAYEAYLRLKKNLAASLKGQIIKDSPNQQVSNWILVGKGKKSNKK